MIHYLTRIRSHLPFSPIALHTPFTPSPHCTNTSTTLLPDLLRGVFYSYSIHRCVGLTGASSLHRHPHTAFHSTPTPIQFPLTFPQPPHCYVVIVYLHTNVELKRDGACIQRESEEWKTCWQRRKIGIDELRFNEESEVKDLKWESTSALKDKADCDREITNPLKVKNETKQ